MSWFRLCLLLLLAVAIPVQSIAAASPQLTGFEHVAINMPGMHMDCHAEQASDMPESPSCCGDACPDMTTCAAGHAVSASIDPAPATGPLTAPDSRYLLPLFSSRLTSPFRPPTILRV